MIDILKVSKDDLIREHFENNKDMQEVVERAYNGDGKAQEYLADWLVANGHYNKSQLWYDKAKTYFNQREN